MLDLTLPSARGRVLHEALSGALTRPLSDDEVKPAVIRPVQPASGLPTVRIDGEVIPTTHFSFTVKRKQLLYNGHRRTCFDHASADRD